MDDTDLTLAARALAGDICAFNDLIREHVDEIREMVSQITSREETSARIIQDVFSMAFAQLENFPGSVSFRSWVASMAYREALAIANNCQHLAGPASLTAEILNPSAPEPAPQTPPPAPDNAPDEPRHQLFSTSRSDLQRRVAQHLERLPDTHRIVYILAELEGHSLSELASLLGSEERQVSRVLESVKSNIDSLSR